MYKNEEAIRTTRQILISARMVLTTMVICCGVYTLLILGIGQLIVPYFGQDESQRRKSSASGPGNRIR